MNCPYCLTEVHPGATRCAACTSWIAKRAPVPEWTRARDGRMLGGVCRGLADHFAVPVSAVRLVFLLGIFASGWSVLVYIALWIAMPLESVGDAREKAAPGDPTRPGGALYRPEETRA